MADTAVTLAAFEALPVEAAILDAEGTITYTNAAWRTFAAENEAPKTDWVGENYLAVCDASDDPVADETAAGLRAILDGDRDTFSLEYPCSSPDEERWFILLARGFEHDGDDYLLVLHINVTERKLAERAVQETNEQLETVTSVLSHDLRNPLSVATGYVDLLADDIDREELETVADALDRMERIIGDAIALARGQAAHEPVPVDLETQAREAWATVVTTDAELVVERSVAFDADASLLANLLENLFRNAVEHGGDGVTVTVEGLADGFAVADDGPGVPPERRDAVFEPGESTDDGTGLGLAIVERVADAHGWAVELGESAAGGARFEVRGVDVVE